MVLVAILQVRFTNQLGLKLRIDRKNLYSIQLNRVHNMSKILISSPGITKPGSDNCSGIVRSALVIVGQAEGRFRTVLFNKLFGSERKPEFWYLKTGLNTKFDHVPEIAQLLSAESLNGSFNFGIENFCSVKKIFILICEIPC